MINQEKIHKKCLSEDSKERTKALEHLKDCFLLLPDKQQAWNDLIKLTADENSCVRWWAVSNVTAFSDVPDKRQAWDDLHRLTNNPDSDMRWWFVSSLSSIFPDIPDKQQAWNDLIKLTTDKDSYVRRWAISALSSVFSDVPDKQQAWNDVHKLITDIDNDVWWRAASTLGSIFSDVEDKQHVWNSLIKLTNSEDSYARSSATYILGSAFSDLPDKQQVWNNIIQLTTNKDSYVRSCVASILGTAFSDIPDKQQVLNNLIKLTNDEDREVRTYTNHSLGKVSIFMASQSEKEEEYERELETAISYFEKAARESPDWMNPSHFCLPFYRTFYTIIFKRQQAKEEVDKYLAEAKHAVWGSKSKKLLIEAVENLANALDHVQSLDNLDFETKKCELNFYRKYCESAAELMTDAEETTPYAIAAMRKGLPILERNLKGLLEEIQKKTETIREQTRGTQFEQLGDELDNSSQFLLQVRDPVGFKKQVNAMQNTLKAICSKFPEGQKGEACELLKMMDAEPSIEDKIPLMVNILGKFSYQLDMTAQLNRIEEKLDQKLSCISYDIFKIKLNSYNLIANLDAMNKELKKLNEIEGLNESSIKKLDSFQAEKLNELNKNILERLDEIQNLIEDLPNNNDTQKIIDSLKELKQSEPDILLQRSSAAISLIGFVMQVLPQVLVHKPA